MGFTNWQERAEKAEEVPALTGASFVGAGGYNADKADSGRVLTTEDPLGYWADYGAAGTGRGGTGEAGKAGAGGMADSTVRRL